MLCGFQSGTYIKMNLHEVRHMVELRPCPRVIPIIASSREGDVAQDSVGASDFSRVRKIRGLAEVPFRAAESEMRTEFKKSALKEERN